MSEEKQLNYIAGLILQCFQESGLDANYIADKRADFLRHNNKYESLHWAIYRLDDTRIAIFAKKLGVSVADLNTTLKVLDSI